MKISVIVSAYDNWQALHWTLLGYRCQLRPCEELLVAEDSRFPEAATVVAHHQARAPFPIRHLTQDDHGFRKCAILNEAILVAQGDWLVFTDADCVPRADLLLTYERLARPRQFLSGGSHVNLPPDRHESLLSEQAIIAQSLFDRSFLRQHEVTPPWPRLRSSRAWNTLFDALTPRNAFVGCNAGVWRSDALAVRGFDESFGYGGEDRNFGIRLINAGVAGRQHKHSLVWLHLDHPRGYTDPAEVQAQKRRNRLVRKSGATQPEVSRIPASR